MGRLIRIAIVCVGLAASGLAHGDSATVVANRHFAAGAYDEALAAIADGLGAKPGQAEVQALLLLEGQILVRIGEYDRALEVYERYLKSGASGANRAGVREMVSNLRAVRTTKLELTVSNGPAVIHLDSRTLPVFCTAAPSCKKGVLPQRYKVIAERAGFVPYLETVDIAKGKATKLAITLIAKPSPLAVRVAQPGAAIKVDGEPYREAMTVPAGPHRIEVTLAGHVDARREVVAAEGKPIDLELALVARTQIHAPAGAELLLDGKPIALVDGGVELAPGPHVVVARAPGFVDRTIAVQAERPDGYAITVELARPPVVPPVSRFTPRRKIALAAGGVAVAALAGGVVLGMQSQQLADDALARCPSPAEPCHLAGEANELNQRGQDRALQANVVYGVAAGAAVAAAILWFTGAPESRVSVTPNAGGVDVRVRF